MRKISFALFGLVLLLQGCGVHPIQEPERIAETPDAEAASVEVLFDGIEWGSSHKQVSDAIRSDFGTGALLSEDAYLLYPDSVFNYSRLAENAGNALVADFDMFGYGTISTLYFMYHISDDGTVDESEDEFYLMRSQIIADDCASAYRDISDQLTEAYGDGSEEQRTGFSVMVGEDGADAFNRDIRETTWAGLNDTFVTLRIEVPENADAGQYLFIAYGVSDVEESLDTLSGL